MSLFAAFNQSIHKHSKMKNLDFLFKQKQRYLIRYLAAFSLLICMLPFGIKAQELVTVEGVVKAAEDGGTLPGVSIMANNQPLISTDNNGQFSVSVAVGTELKFQFVGMQSQTVTVNQNTGQLNIVLERSTNNLEDVVVVGYGEQVRQNLTGAITTVDMEDRENEPITNVSNALHGVPGLFTNLSNSMPGVDRATIRIRGVGTLNNSNPLVLVDGVEYSMDELNPADIANITILKDASAAIYGSRAANGVILVTTKTGKGRSKVNYNYYIGSQEATRLPDAIWDPLAYMRLKNQAGLNSGKSQPEYSDEEIAAYEAGVGNDPYLYPASNWFDIAMEPGLMQKHDLSFSGSSETINYRLSVGFLDRDGIVIGPNNNENKYSLGINTSAKVNDRLTVGLTLNGYYRNYTQPVYGNGDFWKGVMRALPLLPDTLANGAYGVPTIRTQGRNNWEHPRMLAEQGNYKKTVQRFLTTLYADYQLPFNITYHAKLGMDKYDGFQERFVPHMTKQLNQPDKNGDPIIQTWNNPATAPRAYNYDYNDMKLHIFNTLSWAGSFSEDHNLNLMVGGGYDWYHSQGFNAQTTGYLDGSLTAIGVGTERLAINGSSTEDILISYFGRANYDYKEKYLLELTARYDGSSRFAPGKRWGFFPGASAAWRLDKEAFMQDSFFDFFKLRASVGALGNQAVSLYSYEQSIVLGQDYSFGGSLVSGAATNSYSDPNISWETTTSYNLGVDLGILNNKLSFTGEVYKRRTTDILRTVNLPAQVGNLGGPKRNVGTVDNMGYELSLAYRDQKGDWWYDVSGNFNYNKNEVIDLDGQILYDDGTNLSTITQEGLPMNSHYLLDAVGIFQTEEEIEQWADQGSGTIPGFIKYRDVNGDGIINGDDRVVMNSSSIMPKYTFGAQFNLGYKGFDLGATFQGVAGMKVYPTGNIAFPFNNGANATWEWATDAWTPENTNARLPIVTEAKDGQANFRRSDFWLRDGSYLRIRNIQLGYSLPERWLSQIKVQNIHLYVNLQNYFTFSKYKDYDPETSVNVSSLYHYPMIKTLSGGINVTF